MKSTRSLPAKHFLIDEVAVNRPCEMHLHFSGMIALIILHLDKSEGKRYDIVNDFLALPLGRWYLCG